MNLAGIPEGVIDWGAIERTEQPGESGVATVRVWQSGDVQLRVVEYSSGYLGDHWCQKGHLTFVISGEMTIEYQDREPLRLPAQTSYHAPDDGPPHRARSESGAVVFVVD